MSDLDEFLPEFLAESRECLDTARAALRGLAEGGDPRLGIDELFRAIHTIKGGSRMFDRHRTHEVAHRLESFLSRLREQPSGVTSQILAAIEVEVERLESLLEDESAADLGDGAQLRLADDPCVGADRPAKDAASSVDAPPGSNAVSEVTSKISPQAPSFAAPRAAASAASTAKGPEAPRVAEAGNRAEGAGRPVEDLLRVPLARVDGALQTIWELFSIRNRVVHLFEQHREALRACPEFVKSWESLDDGLRRAIGELEQTAMNMRMVPVEPTFRRMKKLAESQAANLGKELVVVLEGASTELDKRVVDGLAEPLTHLIRNAIDHGLERPEVRRGRKKPAAGRLTLCAEVKGGDVEIAIADDGGGIDVERVLEVAKARGLDISHVTDEALARQLIFAPGFSTAGAVTELSGRGVGMDAVKTRVEALGGHVEIESATGQGTRFSITLPLSMSVVPVLLVRSRGRRYAIHTKDVVETRHLGAMRRRWSGRTALLEYEGSFVPSHELSELLDLGTSEVPRRAVSKACCITRTGRGGGSLAAVCVEELEKSVEVVLKPLPHGSLPIPFVVGASVLPSGEPVFVLSLGRLLESRKQEKVQHERAAV